MDQFHDLRHSAASILLCYASLTREALGYAVIIQRCWKMCRSDAPHTSKSAYSPQGYIKIPRLFTCEPGYQLYY
jgi:hypothetical protein